ncbi:MAG: DUF4416 family protein [Chlamydiae bacterium]|nr:DUF4416 family protein [Chlamydiota bacterium]MBI3266128.1 DUF4416 family protein [Chlamydiota bacterium]
MGAPRFPEPVKLFAAVIVAPSRLKEVEGLLEQAWGPFEDQMEPFPFDFTKYYESELGANLIRSFYAFEKLISPEDIRELKWASNEMELKEASGQNRIWNIDPGYIDLDKIVLATTKPATYRIYLGRGIYAQSTLYFKDKVFHPWPWTYQDYKDERALEFFNRVRNRLKENKITPPTPLSHRDYPAGTIKSCKNLK